MNVTLKIFYSDNIYAPALYFCDFFAAWQLWFSLTKSMQKGESGPFIVKVEIWDGQNKLDLTKGRDFTGILQQYKN